MLSVGTVKKQPQITDKTEEVAQLFLAKCARAYVQYTPSLLLTMDETFWPLFPQQQHLVHMLGSPIKPTTVVDPKAGLTLAVTISADSDKLPLYFVCEGKTEVCERKLKPSRDAEVTFLSTHTPNGWMIDIAMIDYLKRIILPHTQKKPSALILDCFRAHITPKVRHFAEKNNIELLVVPACMTSTLAPLDVGINSILKSHYSTNWRRKRLFENDGEQSHLHYADACQFAVEAYKTITTNNIKSSFEKALSLPPPSNLTHIELVAAEQRIITKIQLRNRAENPPSRSSIRQANQLNDPCNNDRLIAMLCE